MAVVNQKRGTGKTTTTENLGIGLAMERKKVLVVDVDPLVWITINVVLFTLYGYKNNYKRG